MVRYLTLIQFSIHPLLFHSFRLCEDCLCLKLGDFDIEVLREGAFVVGDVNGFGEEGVELLEILKVMIFEGSESLNVGEGFEMVIDFDGGGSLIQIHRFKF